MRRVPLAIFVPLLFAACGGGGQDQTPVRPDSVAMALEQYSPAVFDTITWATDTAQTNRGAVVWSFSCVKCHGETGHGDAKMVVDADPEQPGMQPDTIVPPDFHMTDWRFRNDKEGLIKYIFSGNEKRMPHWGIVGLPPRDVDAVATYIQKMLVGTN